MNRGNRRTALYVLYGEQTEGDGVLYIGIAYRPDWRLVVHRRRWWGPQIRHQSSDWFNNREEAEIAELYAIGLLEPLYNTHGQLPACAARGKLLALRRSAAKRASAALARWVEDFDARMTPYLSEPQPLMNSG